MEASRSAAPPPESSSWWPSYWLGHAEGFRVDSPAGDHIGFVDEVLWSPDETDVDGFLVRTCRNGGSTLTVAAGDVAGIRPEASSLVVRV